MSVETGKVLTSGLAFASCMDDLREYYGNGPSQIGPQEISYWRDAGNYNHSKDWFRVHCVHLRDKTQFQWLNGG